MNRSKYSAAVLKRLGRLLSLPPSERAESCDKVVDHSLWSRFDRGAYWPSLKKIGLLAKALGVSPAHVVRAIADCMLQKEQINDEKSKD